MVSRGDRQQGFGLFRVAVYCFDAVEKAGDCTGTDCDVVAHLHIPFTQGARFDTLAFA